MKKEEKKKKKEKESERARARCTEEELLIWNERRTGETFEFGTFTKIKWRGKTMRVCEDSVNSSYAPRRRQYTLTHRGMDKEDGAILKS